MLQPGHTSEKPRHSGSLPSHPVLLEAGRQHPDRPSAQKQKGSPPNRGPAALASTWDLYSPRQQVTMFQARFPDGASEARGQQTHALRIPQPLGQNTNVWPRPSVATQGELKKQISPRTKAERPRSPPRVI